MNTRNGTDVDAGNAMKVFSSLGYEVKVHNDQTVEQMKRLLVSGESEAESVLLVAELSCCPLRRRVTRFVFLKNGFF